MDHQLKELRKTDPLRRNAQKQAGQAEYSPMNPPEAYSPPGMETVCYEDMPALLRKLMDDHQSCLKELAAFEELLQQLNQHGLAQAKETQQGLKQFFSFLDNEIVRHNIMEEKILFPLLQERLLENGEHSKGHYPKTAVDMLEDDHVKVMQLAAVTFNFMGLSSRLPDAASRALVLEAALEQAKTLVELLRLHIFREDNVVFPIAAKYLCQDEFRKMEDQLSGFDHY